MTRFGRRRSAMITREKRRAERSKANAPAIVETPASRLAVTVVDFSATGARLTVAASPPSRQDVCLNINGLALFGTIAWRKDNSFGIKFEESVKAFHPEEIQRALNEAELLGRDFDRESVLQELANKPLNNSTLDIDSEDEQEVQLTDKGV